LSQVRQFEDHRLPTYSNLAEWLERLPMKSAFAHHWLATIENSGMRQEEMEYFGLIYDLACSFDDQKYTKEEMLARAKINLGNCHLRLTTERATNYQPRYQFNPIAKDALPPKVRAEFSQYEVLQVREHPSLGYRVMGMRSSDLFGSGEIWLLFDERWRLIRPAFKPSGMFCSSLEAVDAFYSIARAKFDKFSSLASLQHYERYSWLGDNANYREWLVQLDEWPEKYFSDHFSVKNLLMHIRAAEWSDLEGQKMLLVDEIQSDWHAQGRSCGYLDPDQVPEGYWDAVPDVPFKKEWHELGVKIAIWISLRSGVTRVAFLSGEQHCQRWHQEYEGLRLLYDKQIPDSLKKLAKKFGCTLGWSEIKRKQPISLLDHRKGAGWIVKKADGKDQGQVIRNKTVAMRFWQISAKERLERVRVLEISPILAEVVRAKGVPLFGWWEKP
jgi:hypothetical protein